MLTNIKKILCVIFLTFICISCGSKSSTQESKEGSDPKVIENGNQEKADMVTFVKSFYKTYSPYDLGKDNENKLNEFLSKHSDEFLSKKLKYLILEDIKCTEEGYVCSLDMDPFYNSQDKIILSNALKKTDKSVDVLFDDQSKLTILLDCKDKCLISNILYSDGSNLEERLKQRN